jgi:siroheme decarboxylase
MKINRKIILCLDRPLSIINKPFAPLAKKLGWEERRLIDTVKAYKEEGLIRRLGLVLSHRNIGLKSNALVAWKVPKKYLLRTADIFITADEVSHCYRRKAFVSWPYNIYTMIHGRNRQGCLKAIKMLSQRSGIKDYQVLFTLKELKKTKAQVWPSLIKKKEKVS